MWAFPFLFGPSFFILLPAILLAAYAQWKVRSTYNRYLRVESHRRITAEETAQTVLGNAAISDVTIEKTDRRLSDHYDPRRKVLRLSTPDSRSIAAIGVAAHEAGHAIQHAQGFGPLALRTTIVPIATFGSQLAFPLFFIGLLMRFQPLVTAGIVAFSAAVLFTLITLPVEFDASRRAVAALRTGGIVTEEELGAVKEVLFAAALTYVAAAAMAALQLLMLLSVSRRR
jgi:Zn-dependent membrane protease YugP